MKITDRLMKALKKVKKVPIAKIKCQHSVPCSCPEYLDTLTQEQLLNLRIAYGRVLYINDWLNNFKQNVKRAKTEVEKVNVVLQKKYGFIIIV